VEDPTLCELLNGDVASLAEVNFRNKSLMCNSSFCCVDLHSRVVVLAKITCRSLLVSLCNF
jgi:hypothetical protein